MDPRDELTAALAPLTGVLDRLGVEWYVGGSVASTVHGKFRATNDIDLVAALREAHAAEIARALSEDHYADEGSIREAVRRGASFSVIQFATGLKIDVFVARGDAYELAVRSRRVRAALGSAGTPIWVVSPEDSILTKLVWFRRGGGVSERQWSDVVGVVEVRGAGLDIEYLRTWAPSLAVGDLLDRALAREPRPPAL